MFGFSLPKNHLKEANFLVKSAFGVSAVTFLILLPFGINNFMQGRYVGGYSAIALTILCLVNTYYCYRGRYLLLLNLLAIVPTVLAATVVAVYTLGVKGSYWPFLGVFALYFILPMRYAKVTNGIFLFATLHAAYYSLDSDVYYRFAAVLIGTSFFVFLSVREILVQQDRLHQKSILDPLTGVYNRVQLTHYLDESIEAFVKKNQKSTLLILDIDHFKIINDQYGHEVGDEVLIKLTDLIQSFIGKKDALFRIGGEEFLILMNNTEATEGFLTAEALRSVIESKALLDYHQITISGGVTEIPADVDWKQWMKMSDDKLYKAKEAGRNQVIA